MRLLTPGIRAKFFALATTIFAFALMGLSLPSHAAQAFRVGTDPSYPPMEFKDKTGAIIGFDVDMNKEIAKRLGAPLKLTEINFEGIWQALNAKHYDAAVSSCSITQKRMQNFLFSKPYIANEQVIISKQALAQKLNKLEDLKGLTVAVQTGTTAEFGAQKLLKEKPGLFTLKSYMEATRALDDLGLGRVQAVVVDSVVGLYYVGLNKGKDFAYASASLPPEPIGLAFRKDDTALKAQVDKILDDMRADGTLQAISKKWFGADLVSHVKEEYPVGE